MTQEQLIRDLEKDVALEFDKEQNEVEDFGNEKTKIKTNIMQRIYWTIFGRLFSNFKLKVTLYYKNNVLFEYEIPKN